MLKVILSEVVLLVLNRVYLILLSEVRDTDTAEERLLEDISLCFAEVLSRFRLDLLASFFQNLLPSHG